MMAEVPKFEIEQVMAEGKEDVISILILSLRWEEETYGLTAVARSMINDLWLTDPEAQKIRITCAVLEEEGHISSDRLQEARRHNVQLRGFKRPRFNKKEPKVKWLDDLSSTYFRHLVLEKDFDFIIGYVPYIVSGVFNLQDICHERGQNPKIILPVQFLPKTSNGDVDSKSLINWFTAADLVLSVGHGIEAVIGPYIREAKRNNPSLTHHVYIPCYPLELLKVERPPAELTGSQTITMVTGDKKDLNATCLNFELAMGAAVRATDNILGKEGFDYERQIRMQFMILTSNMDDREFWRGTFENIRQVQPVTYKSISFQCRAVKDAKCLSTAMEDTSVLLLPLKQDSALFGTEALCAAAAGVPILVSCHSGIASVLQALGETRSVLRDAGDLDADLPLWNVRIIEKLSKPEVAHQEAKAIRTKLLQDTSMAASHLQFIGTITGSANVNLTVDLESTSKIPSECLETAVKFSLKLDEHEKTNVHKFLAAFLTKLLYQREKIELGLLDAQLSQAIKKGWRAVLSLLEGRQRKVIGLRSGSVIFMLFCPSGDSCKELEDSLWKDKLEAALIQLFHEIGGLTINSITFSRSTSRMKTVDSLHELTETAALDPSDSGFDTHTVTSNPLSQMTDLLPTQKVNEWLKREPSATGDNQGLTLVERWNLDHLPQEDKSFATFAVADSGNIGISFAIEVGGCKDGSLSVMYPLRDTKPDFLSPSSKAIYYWNPVFITKNNKEYLAAYMTDLSIQLWDIETHTSTTVSKIKSKVTDLKNLCVIDGDTVACADMSPSSDGKCKIHILDTSTDQWSTRSTLVLPTGKGHIYDMCYMKTFDGTRCLLLCCPRDKYVHAVEMGGGKTRWKTDREQIGEDWEPWSITTDKDSMIYVADQNQHKLLVLSADDGVVMHIVNLRQHDIVAPFCVRMNDGSIYISHRDPKEAKKWQISKVAVEIFYEAICR